MSWAVGLGYPHPPSPLKWVFHYGAGSRIPFSYHGRQQQHKSFIRISINAIFVCALYSKPVCHIIPHVILRTDDESQSSFRDNICYCKDTIRHFTLVVVPQWVKNSDKVSRIETFSYCARLCRESPI